MKHTTEENESAILKAALDALPFFIKNKWYFGYRILFDPGYRYHTIEKVEGLK
jgi:hypothetical protein